MNIDLNETFFATELDFLMTDKKTLVPHPRQILFFTVSSSIY